MQIQSLVYHELISKLARPVADFGRQCNSDISAAISSVAVEVGTKTKRRFEFDPRTREC